MKDPRDALILSKEQKDVNAATSDMSSIIENYQDTGLTIQRSNALIGAKYSSTLLENKITAFGIAKLQKEYLSAPQKKMKLPPSGKLWVQIYPGELNALIDKKKNIYREMKNVSNSLIGHSMLIEGENGFHQFAIITDATYVDSCLSICFNDSIVRYISELNGDFTTDHTVYLMSFDNNNAYRIYELLHSHLYHCNPNINNGVYKVSYNIAEFKFMTGIADAEEPGVKKATANKNTIDWDYLLDNVCINKKYNDWYELKRKVLIPAQKSLKKYTDMSFEFKGVRKGGQKIREIDFYISRNIPDSSIKKTQSKKKAIIDTKFIDNDKNRNFNEMDQQYDITDYVSDRIYKEFTGHNGLTHEDIQMLLEKAKYDDNLVEKAIMKADQQEHVLNYIGWILKCIERGGYSDESIEVMNGSKDTAEFIKDIRENAHSSSVKEKMWAKIRQKEDFKEFLNMNDITEDMFNMAYDSIEERISVYTQWRTEAMKAGKELNTL